MLVRLTMGGGGGGSGVRRLHPSHLPPPPLQRALSGRGAARQRHAARLCHPRSHQRRPESLGGLRSSPRAARPAPRCPHPVPPPFRPSPHRGSSSSSSSSSAAPRRRQCPSRPPLRASLLRPSEIAPQQLQQQHAAGASRRLWHSPAALATPAGAVFSAADAMQRPFGVSAAGGCRLRGFCGEY